MNTLKSIHVKDVVVFKDTTFKIKPGISVIRGINKDAKTAKESANACGKSLLFACFANSILHSPPMAGGKNQANTFLPNKATVSVNLKLQEAPVQITQHAKGKTITYDITKNNIPQKVRTPTEMRKAVTNLIPMTDAVFYSTVMVSSFRPPLLWLGTSAQRYDFFEEIAELGFYDITAAKISKKISEIKVQEKVIIPWKAELESLRKIYTGFAQITALKKQLKLIKKQRTTLRKAAATARTKWQAFKNLDVIEFRRLLQDKFKTPQAALECYKKTERKLLKYREQGIALQRAFEAQTRLYAQYPTYLKWQQKIANLPIESRKEMQAIIRKLEAKLIDCESAQSTIDRYKDDFNVYKDNNLIALQGKKPKKNEVEALQAILASSKQNTKLLKELHNTGTCPICRSQPKHFRKLDMKNLATLEANLKLAQLLQVKYLIEDNAELKQAQAIAANYPNIKRRLEAAKLKLVKVERRVTLLENPPEKPDKNSKKITKASLDALGSEVELVKQKFEKAKQTLSKLKQKQKMYTMLSVQFGENVVLKTLEVQARRAQKRYQKAQDKANEIDDALIALQTELASIKLAKNAYRKLNNKYQAAKKIIADLNDWQILYKVFGPTGMRVSHLQSLMTGYIDTMNNLAPFVFSEPVEFSSKLEGRNFSILITRHNATSDVRYLSGAQSRFFIAMSAVSLRKMLTDNKKFNCLILDEIDAGISTAEMEKFTNEFIPYLANEIPSIIIISPKARSEWMIPNATDYNFIRKNSLTTIHTQEQLQIAA